MKFWKSVNNLSTFWPTFSNCTDFDWFPYGRADTIVIDFCETLASAQKGLRSEHVTHSNDGVVLKLSIRKLPIDKCETYFSVCFSLLPTLTTKLSEDPDVRSWICACSTIHFNVSVIILVSKLSRPVGKGWKNRLKKVLDRFFPHQSMFPCKKI